MNHQIYRLAAAVMLHGAWLAATHAQSGAATGPAGPAPVRLSVRGPQIVTPDGALVHWRGFNHLWWTPPTVEDAENVRALGANCVRYMFGYIPRGRLDLRQLRTLRQHVRLFTDRGLWVIPTVHAFKLGDMPDEKNVWNSPELQTEFLAMWDHVLTELKDEPFIAAWEPMNEPHHMDRGRLARWYREVIAHFRAIDAVTPIVVEGANYSGAEELVDDLRLDEPNIVYSFHSYHPHEYTHMRQDTQGRPWVYPGRWDRQALAERMWIAVSFRDRYQVPVWCGEWGVMTGAPGYQEWLRDVAGLLEENRIPWTYWAWAVQRHGAVNESFDVNRQKTEVYKLISGLFPNAAGRQQPLAATRPQKD